MANNYYEATGVLVLDRVTPVITALFGGMGLDANYPGRGQAYIAKEPEGRDAYWNDIGERLGDLAKQLGLAFPPGVEPTLPAHLRLLCRHFGVEDDTALQELIERRSFDDIADLDDLFLIATRFEDGHGLKAIQLEAAWYCGKPWLFEFGGEGFFLSREVSMYSNSSQALRLGNDLHEALRSGDVDEAAQRLAREVTDLMSGIHDPDVRQQLRQRLMRALRY